MCVLVLIGLLTPSGNYAYMFLYTLLVIFINFLLVYSVWKIRKTIKAIEDKFPNDRLVIVHLVNFIVYTVMLLITTTTNVICLLPYTTEDKPIDDEDMS